MHLPPFQRGAWEKTDLLTVGFSLTRAAEAIDVYRYRSTVGDTTWCAAALEDAALGLDGIVAMATPAAPAYDPDVERRVQGAFVVSAYEPSVVGLQELVADLRSIARTGAPSSYRYLDQVREATERLRNAIRRPLDTQPLAPPFRRPNFF